MSDFELSNDHIVNHLIPYVTASEAHQLLLTELSRITHLFESLQAEDWQKPTACTDWNVRDILAHQAGSYANGASLQELIHQLTSPPREGQLPEDAINRTQLRDRKDKSPQELLQELQGVGQLAASKWAFGYRFLKLFSIPHEVCGSLSLRHLMWVIHSRDTWMHRMDVCRATGQPFEQTSSHDGRIVALVIRDIAALLRNSSRQSAFILDLSGPAGGIWKIGSGSVQSTVQMDALDFNIFASGRSSFDQSRGFMNVSGDLNFAEDLFRKILIVY